MEKLGLEIPQFQLHRSLFIKTRSPTSNEVEVGVWLVGVVSLIPFSSR